ncbi:glycolipid transfer protein 2-like [Triticum dicoccoides]|uniref:glycolipid transfer protein 2-like n=1 Tax=Triticum dicoccoides TaxID=85692 RepID=UPI00188EF83C|nr:glycolipid transfer protein 2-like [Triticum dicoccoides]XP_044378993.1 glycolipid transfer protein 2-like [Triticum aestivum]
MEAEIERMKMHKGKSELRMAMSKLSMISFGDGDDQEQEWYKIRSSTMDLLCVSKHFLHVLDVIGPTLLVLSQDIEQNVQRVSLCRDYKYLHATDSLEYASLTAMVMKEVVEGTSKKTNSCARAIIWLARSVNFSIHLLEGLVKNSESSLQEMVEEAYKSTLKPFHGWISSAAYKV